MCIHQLNPSLPCYNILIYTIITKAVIIVNGPTISQEILLNLGINSYYQLLTPVCLTALIGISGHGVHTQVDHKWRCPDTVQSYMFSPNILILQRIRDTFIFALRPFEGFKSFSNLYCLGAIVSNQQVYNLFEWNVFLSPEDLLSLLV